MVPEASARKPYTVTEEVGAYLIILIDKEPSDYGYLPSRWTLEMLAEKIGHDLGIKIHASTVQRLLPTLGNGWNRARPTLCIPDHTKTAKR